MRTDSGFDHLSPEEIRRDLELARLVQESTWPKFIPRVEGFEVAGRTRAASGHDGDFYDALGVVEREGEPGYRLVLDPEVEHLVLLLGDATGHGVGAALVAMELRAIIRAAIRLGAYHRDLVDCMNAQLMEDLPDGRFMTLLMGRLNRTGRYFRWMSFGQAPIFCYRAATGLVETLEAQAPPLGLFPIAKDYLPTKTEFAPGDCFVALSDGYLETRSPTGVLWGAERAKAVIRATHDRGAASLLDAIDAAVDAFSGGQPLADDRTALIIRAVES